MNNGKDSSINRRLECQRHILLWLQGITSQDTVKTHVAQDYFLSRTYASQFRTPGADAVPTVPAEDDYTCFCMNQIERIKATFARKRKQYATGADPLANFFFDTDGSFAAAYENGKGYVKKHIANVLQHDITGNVADSWGDIAVYAIIMLYMIHKHQEEEGEDVQS